MVCLPHAGQFPAGGIGWLRLSLRLTVACLLEQDLQVFLRPAPAVLKSGNWSSGLISPHSLHCLVSETFCIIVGVDNLISQVGKTCIFENVIDISAVIVELNGDSGVARWVVVVPCLHDEGGYRLVKSNLHCVTRHLVGLVLEQDAPLRACACKKMRV